MSDGWKILIILLFGAVIYLTWLAQRDVDELRDLQRRVAVIEQRVGK